MRFARAAALAACILIGEAAANPPEATPPPKPSLDISSQVDRSEITIGDRLHYEIKVVYPAQGRIELPSVLGNLGNFEVKDYDASEPKPAGTLRIQTWNFTLSTFTVGKYVIPPQRVVYLPQGSDSVTVSDTLLPAGAAAYFTQPIEVNVARTSPETVKDIADIAAPAEIGGGTPWLPYMLGGWALLGLIAWLLIRWKAKAAREEEKPLAPPFEEAMARLDGLNAGELVRRNRGRELCFLLSEVLRRYVTRRWEIDAIDMTTTEFLAQAKKLPVTAAHKEFLERFCEGTDLVKFAGAPILESEAESLIARLKEFLSQTRPREVTPGEASEAQGGPGSRSGKGSQGPRPPKGGNRGGAKP